jgi:hypothetical protein
MRLLNQKIGRIAEAHELAREACIYGFPLVDNYRLLHSRFVDRQSPDFRAPWNQVWRPTQLAGKGLGVEPTPNIDTLCAELGADLRVEPLVLTFPAVPRNRYYCAQFIDLYTFNFAHVGTRTTANTAATWLLAGPRWRGRKPDGVDEVIQAETELGAVVYRTQVFRPDDVAQAAKVQAGYLAQPLSAFLGKAPPAQPPQLEWMAPIGVDGAGSSLELFEVLNFVLQFCPVHPSERELLARLEKIDIGPGRRFDVAAFPAEIRQAMEAGMVDAWRAYADVVNQLNSGQLTRADLYGTRKFLKNNFLFRMVGAADGIWGSSREEGYGPSYLVDSDGLKLDATTNAYTLRFPPGQLPPVNGFWSLTLYAMPSRQLVPNPLERHLISSTVLPELQADADGGVTLHIRHEPPSTDLKTNWLPAPKGPFLLVLRLYSPKPDAVNGVWRLPPLMRERAAP